MLTDFYRMIARAGNGIQRLAAIFLEELCEHPLRTGFYFLGGSLLGAVILTIISTIINSI